VPDGYSDYSASEDILRRQAHRTLQIVRRYQSTGSLLEVGCAYGFFLMEAQGSFKCRGIEISAFAAQEAQRRGLDVVSDDLLRLALPREHFEVVCLFDCIEHLTDPLGYLSEIHRLLKPGGVVALTTGDVGSAVARVMGVRWRLMTPPQHLFYFSRQTATRMLERAGFEVVHFSHPWKLVPWRLILYQISPRLRSILGGLARLPLGIYVNFFDAMLVVGRKKTGAVR
jgi:SAM-dependent methyltransferase